MVVFECEWLDLTKLNTFTLGLNACQGVNGSSLTMRSALAQELLSVDISSTAKVQCQSNAFMSGFNKPILYSAFFSSLLIHRCPNYDFFSFQNISVFILPKILDIFSCFFQSISSHEKAAKKEPPSIPIIWLDVFHSETTKRRKASRAMNVINSIKQKQETEIEKK